MSLVRRNNAVFPALMNEIFKPDWFGGMENFNASMPAVNIKDGEKEFELELAVPGRKKADFNIDVDNDLLTVSYEVNNEANETTEKYTRREFSFSSFERRFTLPESINADKIEATYENGILKFVLPKREEALPKPKRTIELS